MDRAQKLEAINELKEVLSGASTIVVTHYRGMTVAEITKLRLQARKNGAQVKVTKNTLATIAANDSGLAVLTELFTGPTVITYSKDVVAAAKTVVDFAKDNEKLVIIGGAVSGQALDEAGVRTLASTPSLDQSRAKIVGLLQAPASQLLRLLQTPGGQVARVIAEHAKQG